MHRKAEPTTTRQDGDVVITIEADDETWEINLTRDLRGSDWLAMEQHRRDISFASVVNAVFVKQVPVVALVLWAYRRHAEPKLTYEKVLDSLDASGVGSFVKAEDAEGLPEDEEEGEAPS